MMPVTPDKWLTEFSASTNNSNIQTQPTAAALNDGGFLIVWTDYSQVGGDNSVTGIKLQRFDALGNKVGAETLVNTTTLQGQSGPDVAVLSDGSYIVTYSDASLTAPDTSSNAIRARHFSADGTPIGNDFVVNTTTATSQLFPTVTALSNGGYAIAWQDASQTGADTSGLAIRYQRFDANDAKVGAEFLVNTTTTGGQFAPNVMTLGDGTYVIAWEDQGSGSVRARHYNANGVDLGGDFVVNTTLSGQHDVHLAALSNGGFVAAWTDGTTSDIKSQLFNQNHAKIGGEFTINTSTPATQDFSAVAALKSGGFFVVWRDFNGTSADTDEGAIRGQLFDNNGSKIGGEILVNTVVTGDQFAPHITELADGRLLVSWTKESVVEPIDNAAGISAQILDPRSGTITGTAGHDVLVGHASGGSMISGLGGDDTLYGGAGVDTAVFSGMRSAYTITHQGSSLIVSGPDGQDTLTGIEKLAFADATVSALAPPVNDFSLNGAADILWRSNSGDTGLWHMSNGQVSGNSNLGNIAANWHIDGSGDFNGDGTSDLLWRNDAGDTGIWLMNNGALAANANQGNIAPNWHVEGTADFNGDGTSDILWRNDAGDTGIWLMQNGQIAANANLGNIAPNWHVAETGDFNGDGTNDILWRSDAGDTGIWLMQNGQLAANSNLGNIAPNWHVAASGDFNGDGTSDVLWRSDAGDTGLWLMKNGAFDSNVNLGTIGTNWHVGLPGDFNGDGTSDLLWHSDAGDTGLWLMNNGHFANNVDLGTIDPAWHTLDHHYDLI
jgi:hypothetical protein